MLILLVIVAISASVMLVFLMQLMQACAPSRIVGFIVWRAIVQQIANPLVSNLQSKGGKLQCKRPSFTR